MKIIDEMRLYYDQRATIYDQSRGYDDPSILVPLQPVIDHIGCELKNLNVFEVACGTGFWTQQICHFANKILATDFNQSTLKQAGMKNLPSDLVSLQQADAYDLSHIEGEFDAAMAIDWFSHVPKSRMDQFLEGLHQILKEGATIIFCDQLAGENSIAGIYDGEGNHIQERNLPNGSKHRVIKHFMTEEEIEARFSAYAKEIRISKFPTCGRLVIVYSLK